MIEFEYMQHMDILLRGVRELTAYGNGGTPIGERSLHVGAGACALSLAWAGSRPGSSHVAVDTDEELLQCLRDFGVVGPRSRIKLRHGDGRSVLEGSSATYDVIVRDAFDDEFTPQHLTTSGWMKLVKSRLREGGLYLANVAHGPSVNGKSDVATALGEFNNVAVIADQKVWRSRRRGNLVVAGFDSTEVNWDQIERDIRRLPLPASLFHRQQVIQWLAGAVPVEDPTGDIVEKLTDS